MTQQTHEHPILGSIEGPEADEEFARVVRQLRAMQHEMDDIAAVAATQISAVAGRYKFKLDSWKPFLEDYAKRHLSKRVDKETGEVKEIKNYKTIEAGGGVFFATKKGSVTVNVELKDFAKWLVQEASDLEFSVPLTELFSAREVWSLNDPQALVVVLHELAWYKTEAEVNATLAEAACSNASLTDEEETKLRASALADWQYRLFKDVNIVPDDPYGYFKVGSKRGWTPNEARRLFDKALSGEGELQETHSE